MAAILTPSNSLVWSLRAAVIVDPERPGVWAYDDAAAGAHALREPSTWLS